MKMSKFLTAVIKGLCVILFAALMLSLVLMIISRNVPFINFDVMWTDEVGRYMLVYLVFLGGGLAMIEDKHIRVDFILNQFSPKVRKWVEVFNYLVTIAFCLVMVFTGFILVQKTGTQMVSTLRKYFNMPMAWWNSAIMVGGGIMAAAVCPKLWKLWKGKDSADGGEGKGER